jgi:2-(1,2-epoxy-1,2-dihydrophenyl)acetyl-CoA isomerase
MAEPGTVAIELDESGVATVEFSQPPFNYFSADLLGRIADAYARLEDDRRCRAIVLCSAGRHFCAGADFGDTSWSLATGVHELYRQGLRLFTTSLPVVAAVQGRAVGGGLGLALSADLRVGAPSTTFACNFARLGLHHGFGLTVTLPAAVGFQKALELLTTGGELDGAAAREAGLCDALDEDPRAGARALATRVAAAAPLAVQAIRRTMRAGLVERVRDAMAHEAEEQALLVTSADFAEGTSAARARRAPRFTGT